MVTDLICMKEKLFLTLNKSKWIICLKVMTVYTYLKLVQRSQWIQEWDKYHW